MREIVLDTETTGLDPGQGHRIVDIGCVELVNLLPTGAEKQWYINPEREMPADAARIHGLTDAFLSDKPPFSHIVREFVDFIGDSCLVIHNAAFDMKFINAELERHGYARLPFDRAIDTVAMARQRFPGAQANLDALCKRFGIDNTDRSVHGALIDARLLASVYLELRGGRQANLALDGRRSELTRQATGGTRAVRPPRSHGLTATERKAHAAMLDELKNPIWHH